MITAKNQLQLYLQSSRNRWVWWLILRYFHEIFEVIINFNHSSYLLYSTLQEVEYILSMFYSSDHISHYKSQPTSSLPLVSQLGIGCFPHSTIDDFNKECSRSPSPVIPLSPKLECADEWLEERLPIELKQEEITIEQVNAIGDTFQAFYGLNQQTNGVLDCSVCSKVSWEVNKIIGLHQIFSYRIFRYLPKLDI